MGHTIVNIFIALQEKHFHDKTWAKLTTIGDNSSALTAGKDKY